MKKKLIKCTCKLIKTRHGWGCQCDDGCPNEDDKFVMCPMHEAAPELLLALKKLMADGPDANFDYDALVARAENKG